RRAPDAVVIVVTNPLDAMTFFLARKLGFARPRVFGMGITLDASRFANLISKKLSADITAIRACVIGSHGESMVPLPRFTTVNGTSLDRLVGEVDIRELVSGTVNRGKEIVSLYGTGSAYYAPSAAICQLVRAVALDSKETLGVSAFVNGEYGLKDICVGLPCVIGRNGAEKVVELDLNGREKAQLTASADAIKELINLLKL
ncbi:MAG TPA: malate dehydrogenase, partial [Candidatus Omnitrophota bacterium]|nr:malate dehydrogenase [Candidatus Omnitrophota bacterium]